MLLMHACIHAGLASVPDDNGFLRYARPEGKSGGHGVGWSEIPRYSFKLPSGGGWTEIPVSIADLGGTEVSVQMQWTGADASRISYLSFCTISCTL